MLCSASAKDSKPCLLVLLPKFLSVLLHFPPFTFRTAERVALAYMDLGGFCIRPSRRRRWVCMDLQGDLATDLAISEVPRGRTVTGRFSLILIHTQIACEEILRKFMDSYCRGTLFGDWWTQETKWPVVFVSKGYWYCTPSSKFTLCS